jgi:hypothetical protein
MTVNSYDSRGGNNYAVVLLCPNIVANDHLVYFDYNAKSRNWVIRDFITGQRLDNHHSTLTVEQIEADATHAEFPVWHNVENFPADWRTYLTLRTTAVRGLRHSLGSTNLPNPASGIWRPLR